MSRSIALDNGMIRCTVLRYGAIVQSLQVPDRNGRLVDVVLGCDTQAQYALSPDYMGAVVGRYANRISGAAFRLDGVCCRLTDNCGGNHIHGGFHGFSAKVWEVAASTDASVTLSCVSEDGEEGYPGRMEARVCYTLEGTALHIAYDACTSRDTVCNLTNHAYFNLAGHDSGSILTHQLMLCANCFLPAGPDGVPYGTLEPVDESCMDFRTPHPIGLRIDDDDRQLRQSGGYDHCFSVNGAPGRRRKAAWARSETSGISMEVETDMPGIQLYTANGLGPGRPGKGGASYGPRDAFCLETQYFPNSPNQDHFPSSRLNAGERYKSETVYRFSAN